MPPVAAAPPPAWPPARAPRGASATPRTRGQPSTTATRRPAARLPGRPGSGAPAAPSAEVRCRATGIPLSPCQPVAASGCPGAVLNSGRAPFACTWLSRLGGSPLLPLVPFHHLALCTSSAAPTLFAGMLPLQAAPSRAPSPASTCCLASPPTRQSALPLAPSQRRSSAAPCRPATFAPAAPATGAASAAMAPAPASPAWASLERTARSVWTAAGMCSASAVCCALLARTAYSACWPAACTGAQLPILLKDQREICAACLLAGATWLPHRRHRLAAAMLCLGGGGHCWRMLPGRRRPGCCRLLLRLWNPGCLRRVQRHRQAGRHHGRLLRHAAGRQWRVLPGGGLRSAL